MATTDVHVAIDGANIIVQAPYEPRFPSLARALGGKWNGSAWVFDARDQPEVRDLCRSIYGTDGSPCETVTLQVTWPRNDCNYDRSCYVAGRLVARAFDRDSGARLGEGVILRAGGFSSGGSRKSPSLTVDAGTTVLLRDVPRASAVRAVENGGDMGAKAEIVDEATDREKLQAEKDALLARLAEIDAVLDV